MELLVYFVITEGSWIKIRVKSLQVSNWKTKPAVQTKSKRCEDSSRGAAASEASCRAPRTRRPAKIPSILFSKNTERCITWILRVYFHRSTPLDPKQDSDSYLVVIPLSEFFQTHLLMHLVWSLTYICVLCFLEIGQGTVTSAMLSWKTHVEKWYKSIK